jgi:hypothetical protein
MRQKAPYLRQHRPAKTVTLDTCLMVAQDEG